MRIALSYESHCRPARALVWIAWMLGASAGVALPAQTGALLPKSSEIRGAPQFLAAPVGEEVDGVDQRRHFPPVGSQSMNDCAAWAISAAKGFLEARDQGWSPDRPQTMFSPSFIYNQINNGQDEGASLVAAALLLEKLGAATLKTAPYVAQDFTSQPPEFAFEEAGRFKNRASYLLETGEQIRLALQQNLAVVVGARLTPHFFSGTLDVYTPAEHAAGMRLRRSDQPHAMHAMAVVAYDDTLRRFLLRNSWGEGWGRRGHCWVSYDVMETADPSSGSEEFLFLAIGLEDAPGAVEATPDIEEGQRKSLRIVARGEANGFDRRAAATRYRFSAELVGPEATLALVHRVTWHPPQSAALETEDAARRFRVFSSIPGEAHPIAAEVQFRDGTSRRLEAVTAFVPPNADDSQIELTSADRYWGMERDPKSGTERPRWRHTVKLEGPVGEVRSVDRYRITHGDEVRSVAVGNTSEIGPIYLDAFEPRPIEATLYFSDGRQVTRTRALDAFTDPADESLWMESALHRVGDGSRSAYRLWVRIPAKRDLFTMDRVEWKLDGSQEHHGYVDHFGGHNGYQLSGIAARDFRARATIFWSDGSPPSVLERWIELPDEGTAYATPARLDLWSDSVYTGRDDSGAPRWSLTARLSGDWEATAAVNGATLVYALDGEERRVEAARDEQGDWVARLHDVPRSVELTAEVRRAGEVLELRRTLTARAPVIDTVHLNTLSLGAVAAGDPGAVGWSAEVGGPGWHRWVHTALYTYEARVGGWLGSTSEESEAVRAQPHPFRALLRRADGSLPVRSKVLRSSPRAGEVQARLYYDSGWSERLTGIVRAEAGDWTGPSSAVTVRCLERFMGADDPDGPYRGQILVEGAPEALAEVDHFLLRDARVGPERARRWAVGQRPYLRSRVPFDVIVTLVAKDGTEDSRTVRLGCKPERLHALELRRTPTFVSLMGPGAVLDQVQGVDFELTPEGGAPVSRTSSHFAEGGAQNAVHYPAPEPLHVVASARFKDGTTRRLEQRLALPVPGTTRVATQDRYWGTVNGEPAWQLHHRIAWPFEAKGAIQSVAYRSYWAGTGSDGGPDFDALVVVRRDQVENPEGFDVARTVLTFRDESWLDLGEREHELESPILSGLALRAARTWTNPTQAPNAAHEWQLWVEGPVHALDELERVDYRFAYPVGDATQSKVWSETEPFSLDGDGFRAVPFVSELSGLSAELHFRDGRPATTLTWERAESR